MASVDIVSVKPDVSGCDVGCVDTIVGDVAVTGGRLSGVSVVRVGETVGTGMGSELILSNLTLLRTTGAVILQTG